MWALAVQYEFRGADETMPVIARHRMDRYRYRYRYKYKWRYKHISIYRSLTIVLKTLLLGFFAGVIRF